jgi:DNA-binding CsgD family transcriptional regulator
MTGDPEKLSEREEEILRLAAQGLTDKAIAASIGVQISTVRTYWDRLKTKLDATNRTEAVARSLRPIPTDSGGASALGRFAESIPYLFALVDGSGQVEFANARWNVYFGSTASDWSRMIHPDDRAKSNWHNASLADGQSLVRFRRTDGAFRWHLASQSPYNVPDGRVAKWVRMAVDVHELRPKT